MTKKHHASASEKQKEDWMNSKWRPMMGWMYMTVCACDFMLFPILWSLLQSLSHGQVTSQWQPLTLQGAGLFHVAMGAVLGIAAYGRTQEKLGGANNGGIQLPPNAGTTYVPPGTQNSVNLGSQPNPGFGGNVYANSSAPGTSFTPTPSWGSTGVSTSAVPAAVTTGYGGKKAPPQPDFPEI
jgi:Holin of 3TMs, for gene-transfer release